MRRLVALLFVFAVTSNCLADCKSPVQAAKSLFARHEFFYMEDPEPFKNVYSENFFKLLQKEWTYTSANNGTGNLKVYPWTGVQIGEVGQPINWDVESLYEDNVVVSMKFPLIIDPKKKAEMTTAHLVMVKEKSECWLLHEFITPDGISLSHLFAISNP